MQDLGGMTATSDMRRPQVPSATDNEFHSLSVRKSLEKQPASFESSGQVKALLALIDKRPGSTKQWQGDVLHRLKAAASGGSLNDTRAGKQPGTFRRY